MDQFFPDDGIYIALVMMVIGLMAAWAATRSNDGKRKIKDRTEQLAAVNQAIQIIASVRSSLTLYRRETIEPALASEAPWLEMQAQVEGKVETISFPEEELMFLLKTEHDDLFAEYLAEERRFLALLRLVEERSKIVSDSNFPKTEQDIAPDLAENLKDLTDEIIKRTKESIESLESFYHRFRNAMTEHLDGEGILFELKFENE